MKDFDVHRSRGLVAGVVVIVTTMTAASVLIPALTDDVWAQAQETTTIQPIQTPPAVPGIDYTVVGSGNAGIAAGLVPATPTPPDFPSGGTNTVGDPAESALPATNLGGSDVAVSSVGGSYQVDGPKRRADRIPRVTPQP